MYAGVQAERTEGGRISEPEPQLSFVVSERPVRTRAGGQHVADLGKGRFKAHSEMILVFGIDIKFTAETPLADPGGCGGDE